jgi:hypothetical protein
MPALAKRGIRIRAGVHVGECVRRGDEWSGMAVHTGARIGALAGAGEVLASRTVRDLSAGSGLTFESLGPQRLKSLPEEVDVYRVTTPTSGLTPYPHDVDRIGTWTGHRPECRHRVGVIVGEQGAQIPSVVVTLLRPLNRLIPGGAIPAATHGLR